MPRLAIRPRWRNLDAPGMLVDMKTTTRLRCRRCGADLEQPLTGRPPSYCGPACRRQSEYSIRRWTRLLERLEAMAVDARIEAAMQPARAPEARRRGKVLASEIARIEHQLAAIVGDDA